MTDPPSSELVLPDLDPEALEDLASALASDRLRAPFSASALRRLVGPDKLDDVRQGLSALAAQGFAPAQTAALLRILAVERRSQRSLAERLELVWSGPAVPGQALRDTAVIVRSMCQSATRSALIANFSFDQQRSPDGVARARALWQPLADAMTLRPELHVRMIVNVARDDERRPHRSESQWRAAFLEHFHDRLWPEDTRHPALYYDPRALHPDPRQRAIMHAKCIVVDLAAVFLSSANFTHAGQERNIEAGLVVPDPALARRITEQFDALISQGSLRPLSTER